MKIEAKETTYTIYNAFSRRSATPVRPGSTLKKVFGLKLNDRFKKEPYVVKEFDIKEYINSFRDTCDMKVIISRYLSGDPNIKLASNYGDVSDFGDLRRALDIKNRVTSIYDGLSADIKSAVTFDQFLTIFGSEEGLKAVIGAYNASKTNVIEKELSANES